MCCPPSWFACSAGPAGELSIALRPHPVPLPRKDESHIKRRFSHRVEARKSKVANRDNPASMAIPGEQHGESQTESCEACEHQAEPRMAPETRDGIAGPYKGGHER